jgi:hypothetical protein
MRHMLELMQSQIDDFSRQLDAIQNPQPRRRGRPPQDRAATTAAAPTKRRMGWSDDPEERRREMQRRRAVRFGQKPKVKLQAKLHPRDPSHPGHAVYIANIKKAVKKAWRNMSDEQRAARLAKMVAGHKTKKKPVKLAVAS